MGRKERRGEGDAVVATHHHQNILTIVTIRGDPVVRSTIVADAIVVNRRLIILLTNRKIRKQKSLSISIISEISLEHIRAALFYVESKGVFYCGPSSIHTTSQKSLKSWN